MRNGHAPLVLAGEVEIPTAFTSLAGFRAWTRSRTFPGKGRIDELNENRNKELLPRLDVAKLRQFSYPTR